MNQTYRVLQTICFNYDPNSDITICCSIDDSRDEIIELSGDAQKVFQAISKEQDEIDHNPEVVQALLEMGLIEQVGTPQKPYTEVESPSQFEKFGISIKGFNELYTPELEAYGFTTLTASNCSSYSDSS